MPVSFMVKNIINFFSYNSILFNLFSKSLNYGVLFIIASLLLLQVTLTFSIILRGNYFDLHGNDNFGFGDRNKGATKAFDFL